MKAKRTVAFMVALVCIILPLTAIPTKRIDVFVFSSKTCGSCREMSHFLDDLYMKYPTMVIQEFDISEQETKVLYDLFKQVYTLDMRGHPVPMVFIGKDAFQGYGPDIRELLEKKVAGCFRAEGCSIALTVEKDCIVIIDHTPTPELSGIPFLIPFLVLAGIICLLNPFNAEIVSKVKRNISFLAGYSVTSFVLCFALSTVVFFVSRFTSFYLFVVIAIGLGVLTVVSAIIPVLKVPQSIRTALNELISDNTGFSFFSLGIGTCLASLVYTAGIYLLVVYTVFSFSLEKQLQYFGLFNGVILCVFVLVYTLMAKGKPAVYYSAAGVGSIGLALFWLLQVI